MKNDTNIYDIDGTLIRAAGDNHKFTIEEVEALVDRWTEKVKENPDNKVYKVYLNNVNKWLYNMYNNMSKEDLVKRLSLLQDTINEGKEKATAFEQEHIDKMNAEIEKLKDEYKNDEYVEYEEVK